MGCKTLSADDRLAFSVGNRADRAPESGAVFRDGDLYGGNRRAPDSGGVACDFSGVGSDLSGALRLSQSVHPEDERRVRSGSVHRGDGPHVSPVYQRQFRKADGDQPRGGASPEGGLCRRARRAPRDRSRSEDARPLPRRLLQQSDGVSAGGREQRPFGRARRAGGI